MEETLRKALSPRRFQHSLGVVEVALSLAARYGADAYKARLAALLHDCAKNLPEDEQKRLCHIYRIRLDAVAKSEPCLLHAYVGAHLARDIYGVCDEEVQDAIFYHTTGKENMSLLCKIIFLADMIEPNRAPFPALSSLRRAASEDLDAAVFMALTESIRHVLSKGRMLHADTVLARNFYLETRKDLLYGNQG